MAGRTLFRRTKRLELLGETVRTRGIVLDGTSDSIEAARAALRFEASLSSERPAQVAGRAGVCTATLVRMLDGTTREPRATTLARMLGAVGYVVRIEREERAS